MAGQESDSYISSIRVPQRARRTFEFDSVRIVCLNPKLLVMGRNVRVRDKLFLERNVHVFESIFDFERVRRCFPGLVRIRSRVEQL